jgi:hypothetical protein
LQLEKLHCLFWVVWLSVYSFVAQITAKWSCITAIRPDHFVLDMEALKIANLGIEHVVYACWDPVG